MRVSPLSLVCAFLLSAAFLAPISVAVGQNGTCTLPNSDTTPPFTDRCYHQGVWFSPDTADLDVLILPPTTPWGLREWQLLEQSVANWETGIRTMGAPWMSGLHINEYMVGREPVPPAAMADPEVILAVHTNAGPLGSYAGLATQWAGVCHGLQLPTGSGNLPTNWHEHAGSPYASYAAACGGGGRVCFVTNAATLAVPGDNDRRMDFDLISHEVGHCLSLGHVGDADTESSDDSVAYPEHDIMSYENDGIRATTMHCPSNLNIRVLEKAYGSVLGQPGATTAVAPNAAGYVNMHPNDWNAPACVQSKALVTDTGYLTAADPLGLNSGPDSDGDGIPDADDACPGFDDRLDADADGIADGCDDNDNDGPGGDLDGDGVTNADDRCPGIDDNSPACLSAGGKTLYFGRGTLGSPSGNLDVLAGDSAFLQLNLVMDEGAPEFTDPAVILAPGIDGTAPHNPFYEPAEWASADPVLLSNQDVEVVWWGIEPATGGAFLEQWEVKLFFNGAATPVATASLTARGLTDGAVPTEYRVTIPGVTGTGTLSVQIDPASFANQQDFLILYDAVDFPSRLVMAGEPVVDTDGDGVPDDEDACPGFNDAADLDGDAIPDGCDSDRDGDGVNNGGDRFPDDPSEWADSDNDGVGNNADTCPGHDDALDWDGDGIPDGCDDRPGVEILSPVAGTTVEGTFTVNGATPGTATVGTAALRIPDVLAMGDLLPYGVLVEPWMHAVRDQLDANPAYRGLLPTLDGGRPVLHLFVDGGLAASDVPSVPQGWTVEVHSAIQAEPRMLQVSRDDLPAGPVDTAATGPELPRGGVVNQGIGPGAPMYIQWDGDRTSVGICTANYVWKDQDGRLWVGAAGHCFLPEDVTNNDGSYDYSRTEVWVCRSDCVLGGVAGAQAFFAWQEGLAPLDIVKLGAVGYARQDGVGQDFGFAAVPASLVDDLEPEMPGFGGPYGVNPNGFVSDLYLHHGNGVGTSETAATKSRVGVGDGDGGDKTSWAMVGVSFGGDSGSAMNSISAIGILDSEDPTAQTEFPQARGLLTHGAIDPILGAAPLPISFGTTIAQAQAMANEGGFCLVLVMADEDPATRPAAPQGAGCAPSEVPGMVLGLAASAGDGQVALSWLAPDDDGGSPITGYTVHYGLNGMTDQSQPASSTSAVVTGLQNGLTYTFTVDAHNEVGSGPASAPVTATPAKPVRFTVELRVDEGAWQPVAGYDESTETWQAQVTGLANGQHVLEARLLDLGVQRDVDTVVFHVMNDSDGDGIPDDQDVCSGFDDGLDADGDGIPDACDPDVDGDGAPNGVDNCPVPNPDQADLDGDSLGDACDGDRDGDGVANEDDAFPSDFSEWSDADGDGVGDNSDACAGANDALDLDADGIPDGCDADRDGDGASNDAEVAAGTDPDDPNSTPPTEPVCYKPNGKPGKCKSNGSNAQGSYAMPVLPRGWI